MRNFQFDLPANNLSKKPIIEENDDFEAMFLSDISLSSKNKANSVITNFKQKNQCPHNANQLNLLKNLRLDTQSNQSDNSSVEINKFIDNLKELPLLDMDDNLRKLINEKYLNLKKDHSSHKTRSFTIFDLFYKRNSYNQRYKFNVKEYFSNYVHSVYELWLKECPQEIVGYFEFDPLG